MTTRLIIARHGNTFAFGEPVRRIGTTDLPLVDWGLEQGRLLGTYLKENDLIPNIIFTSQLKRTIQTAEQAQRMMNTDLTINTSPLFNEIDYGPDENQSEEHVIARIGEDALKAWEKKGLVPEGWLVTPSELINNWLNFSKYLCKNYSGQTCLVVTSNGIARFAPHITGDFITFSTQYPIKIATGALCLFENRHRSKKWDCLAWNIKPSEVLKSNPTHTIEGTNK
jgi:2,3-bisphosphoglycerate-dependent phosphoglycerate mutase